MSLPLLCSANRLLLSSLAVISLKLPSTEVRTASTAKSSPSSRLLPGKRAANRWVPSSSSTQVLESRFPLPSAAGGSAVIRQEKGFFSAPWSSYRLIRSPPYSTASWTLPEGRLLGSQRLTVTVRRSSF